jgi:hypothetical protein
MITFVAGLKPRPLKEDLSQRNCLLIEVGLGGVDVRLGRTVVGDLRVATQTLLPGLGERQDRSESQQQRDG